jgi:3-oxoacyl-[acyl-carrier protein] reductase
VQVDLLLRDKVALVTGGGRGIGREIALQLAREGVHVAVCGRSKEPLEATVAEIEGLGVRGAFMVVDLINPSDCIRAVEETVTSLGGLDILVNNASTNVIGAHPTDLEHLDDDQLLERVMIKGVGAVRCTRAALPYLRRSGQGRVICLGGVNSRIAAAGALAIGLGNAFVAYFAKSAGLEFASDGITVNVISPSGTRGERHSARMKTMADELGTTEAEAEAIWAKKVPIGRVVDQADVAVVAVFLASPLAGAITGQNIAVDGGMTPAVVY